MRIQGVIVSLATTAWCMNAMIKPEAEEIESDSRVIQEMLVDQPSSSTPQYQGFAVNPEQRDSKIPKITKSPQFQGLNENMEHGASEIQSIAQYIPKPNFSCTCQPKYHCRYVFQILIQDSHLLKNLHPKKALILSRFWERNHDKVLSINKDMEEILGIQLQNRNYPWGHTPELQSEDDKIKIQYTKELFEKTKEKISILKDLRLFQLGGLNTSLNRQRIFKSLFSIEKGDKALIKQLDRYPEEMVYEILKNTWETFSCSIVEDIKKMMISYNSQATHLEFYNKKSVVSGQYLFNFMDFAHKQNWIGQEKIQKYFHDNVLAKHALGFAFQVSANLSREHGGNVYIWDVLESVAKHWHWPLTHELFKVLGEKEEKI
ncbi:hypothetical protein PGT21_023018 [Puccinia graminis f. sp. tritici]|uniref:Uncharacterized protein n=1 Tax=Puccinia graminis f. sp. tritici TaxID=56615 RepID=A0A5B0R1A7_PUCGR|nr:hypothetical protein PGT21_023018 [Puccinia graminis f. sp. tritici]